jgi:ankyrin repeat protein
MDVALSSPCAGEETAMKKIPVTIIFMLLERGANVQARDDLGWTALDWALKQDNAQVVKLLKDHGAK